MARQKQDRAFLSRIRFDGALEDQALECLAELDFSACRRKLAELIGALELEGAGAEEALSAQLLLDVLHRVNLELYRTVADTAVYQANRLSLIRQFSLCTSGQLAKRRFMPALNRLMASASGDSPPVHSLVLRAKSLIERSYRNRISLSTVATALNVSPNHLSRLFRRETGVTLTAYIQRVRLKQATQLLAHGGRRISEIAYLVGYQNYRDFHRNFVKYENASPRQVRRSLAAKASAG